MAEVHIEGRSTYGQPGDGGREVEFTFVVSEGRISERVHVFGWTLYEGERKWTAYRRSGRSLFTGEMLLDPVTYAPSLSALKRKLESVELAFNWKGLD